MEIVTGKAGVPHVSSADDGRRIAGEVGTGSYVLQTGGKLAPSLVDANTVRIATGDMIVQGRHIGVTAPEDVKVASGSQGKKRMDYICVHYTRDVSGSSPTLVEKVEWKVLQGTPGSSAAAPSVPKGSILDGDADATVPVCSVTFDGLTTGQPKLLIPTLTPLATLGDSVSHAGRVFSGDLGKLAPDRNGNIQLWTTDDFKRAFGAEPKNCFIAVSNRASGGSGIWLATPRWNENAVFTTQLSTRTDGAARVVPGDGNSFTPVAYLVAAY